MSECSHRVLLAGHDFVKKSVPAYVRLLKSSRAARDEIFDDFPLLSAVICGKRSYKQSGSGDDGLVIHVHENGSLCGTTVVCHRDCSVRICYKKGCIQKPRVGKVHCDGHKIDFDLSFSPVESSSDNLLAEGSTPTSRNDGYDSCTIFTRQHSPDNTLAQNDTHDLFRESWDDENPQSLADVESESGVTWGIPVGGSGSASTVQSNGSGTPAMEDEEESSGSTFEGRLPKKVRLSLTARRILSRTSRFKPT